MLSVPELHGLMQADTCCILNAAGPNCPGVAKGKYKPTSGPAGCTDCMSSRDSAFLIKEGVALYGGFFGNETSISQRNIIVNETILSGDFNDNDIFSGNGVH